MERETGIEPATSSLGSWRSTAELLPLTGELWNVAIRRTAHIAMDAGGTIRTIQFPALANFHANYSYHGRHETMRPTFGLRTIAYRPKSSTR
jgi:hypothetical protein